MLLLMMVLMMTHVAAELQRLTTLTRSIR